MQASQLYHVVNKHTNICSCICMHMYVCVCMCVCVYTCLHEHQCVCTYIHIHTYIHTHTHTHTHYLHKQASRTPSRPRTPSRGHRVHGVQDPFADDDSGLRRIYDELRRRMKQCTPDTQVDKCIVLFFILFFLST
jgi:hypothetical protein